WDEKLNQAGVKGFAPNKPRPSEIKYEQFNPSYYTVLCNDIAAAKAFLDDRQDVNASNLALVGAKDGATLGALWLNSEWHRVRLPPPAQGQPQGSLDRENPAGAAVSAAVWLSISPTIGSGKGSITANVSQILDLPGKFRKVPMAFVYGEGDSKSGDV